MSTWCQRPKVAAGLRPGDFRVAWEDDRNGATAWNVWYRATADGGASWSPAVRLSDRGSGAPYKSTAGFRFPYGDYFGITVDTMPTPIKSIARMQTAISQCSRRWSGVKRRRTPIMAWCPFRFEDNPWPQMCEGHRTSCRRLTVPPGTGRPMFVCRSAGRLDRN